MNDGKILYGDTLRQRRRAFHLTQLQVARLAGISRRRYAGIERGESTSLQTLHDVAAVLGCSVTVTLTLNHFGGKLHDVKFN